MSCLGTAGLKGRDGTVDKSQKPRAFFGTVDRQTLPIAGIPQIGKETRAILMKNAETPCLSDRRSPAASRRGAVGF
jgi:hypothetical protein